MGEIQPVALEDVLHLQFEQAGVGEHLALAAEDPFFGVIFKQGMQVVDTQGHGRGLRCFCVQAGPD
ncbi:hypothetical protein D9M71_847120 [compost metagenome]